jgi:hypothetical protein
LPFALPAALISRVPESPGKVNLANPVLGVTVSSVPMPESETTLYEPGDARSLLCENLKP